MKNIETIIKEAGIELTEEQEKAIRTAVSENYKAVADYDKQVAKYSALEDQYKTVKASLDKFDGVDVDALKKQITDAQQAAKDAEEKAKADLAARDYTDAVMRHADTLTFSSTAAKKSFIADLTAKELKLENGKLMGFDDFVTAFKEADGAAIVDPKAAENKAKFTTPMQRTGSLGMDNDALTAKMAAVMGIKLKEEK